MWSDIAEALDLPEEVAEAAPSGPRLSITLTNRQVTNPVIVSYEAHPGLVRDSRELIRSRPRPTRAPERSVRHIEIGLPAGTTYQAGDHLGVLPRNGIDTIRRVMARFGLDAGQYVTIIPNSGTHTHLPIEEPTPLLGVLGSCVELQDVATRDDVAVLARHTDDPQQKAALEAMAGDDEAAHAAYRDQVYVPNRSVLDLLDEFPACHLPFEVYLDLLPALRPRYFSISSSPLVSPDTCSITAGVLRAPARSGTGTFTGVCSNHLANVPGRRHRLRLRPPTVDPVPASGEPARPDDHGRRGHRAGSVPRVPPGARGAARPGRPDRPRRCCSSGAAARTWTCCTATSWPRSRRRAWSGRSAASRPSPARSGGTSSKGMLDCADEVWDLLQHDAVVLVCGNASTIAPGVRASLTTIFRDRTGAGESDAAAWLAGLRTAGRLVEDIWGG